MTTLPEDSAQVTTSKSSPKRKKVAAKGRGGKAGVPPPMQPWTTAGAVSDIFQAERLALIAEGQYSKVIATDRRRTQANESTTPFSAEEQDRLLEAGYYDFLAEKQGFPPTGAFGAILSLLRGVGSVAVGDLNKFRRQLEGSDSAARGDSYFLLGRLMVAGCLFRIFPASQLLEARNLFSLAVRSYEEAGDAESALRVKMRIASVAMMPPCQEWVVAESLLQGVSTQTSFVQLAWEAKATLAECRVRWGHLAPELLEVEVESWRKQRDKFSANGWVNSLLNAGDVLLLRGVDSGGVLIREAIKEANSRGYLVGEFQGWSKIGTYALSCGDISEGIRAFGEAHTKATEMGFLPGAASALTSLLHCLLLQGRSDEALVLVAQLKSDYCESVSGFGTISLPLASAFHQLGLIPESLALLNRAVRQFESLGESILLSHACWLHGTIHLSNKDLPRARVSYERAIRLDEDRGDIAGVIEKILTMTLGEMSEHTLNPVQVSSGKRSQKGLVRSRAAFKRCRGLLELLPEANREVLTAKVLQGEGELLFLSGKRLQALPLLTEARQLFVSSKRLFDVASVDVLVGLVSLEIARHEQVQHFGEAYEAFQRARETFQSLGVHQEVWKMHLYAAIALQGAVSVLVEGDQRRSLVELADQHLERGWGVIDALERRSARNGSGSFFLNASKHQLLGFAGPFAEKMLSENEARLRVWQERFGSVVSGKVVH